MEFFSECLSADSLSWYVCAFRLLLSFLAGCAFGLERKFRTQFVGMRTLILICVSSTVLMLLSMHLGGAEGGGDPARIAAQVVSGIGFLGGGAILRQGFNVKGLTSAAIIWTAAALGLAIGAGFLLPAGVALVICLCSLIFIERFEERRFPAEQMKTLSIECGEEIPSSADVERVVMEYGVVVTALQGASSSGNGTVLLFDVRIPKYVDFSALDTRLRKDFTVVSVVLE